MPMSTFSVVCHSSSMYMNTIFCCQSQFINVYELVLVRYQVWFDTDRYLKFVQYSILTL